MFVGHFAIGLAAKRATPRISLAWLLVAPLFLDVLWPVFLTLGFESARIDPGNTAVTPLDLHDYPYSHSLAMAALWSLLGAALTFGLTRRSRDAFVIGGAIFSHWLLDFVSHRPDMPLYPGSTTYVGLGLWHSLPATLAVEIPMFLAGFWLYMRATSPRDGKGRVAPFVFVAVLFALYLAAMFGPPPPNMNAVVGSSFAMWLFAPWAAWVDGRRTPVAA